MKFGLRTLLVVMLILSAIFAYLAYYRLESKTVAYQSALIPATAQGKWANNLSQIADSPYSYKLLTKEELVELENQLNTIGTTIIARKSTIHMWPKQSTSNSASRPLFLPVVAPSQGANPAKIPASTTGFINGFLGIRRAGRQVQFRVDVDARIETPEKKDAYSIQEPVKYEEAVGHLYYEGKAPEHGLLFVAPMGEHSLNVVLFQVESQQLTPQTKPAESSSPL